jgi:hypothetical protein
MKTPARDMNEVAEDARVLLEKLPKEVVAAMIIADGLYYLGRATRAIAHGDVDGPGGLEGLTMALSGAGEKISPRIAEALDAIAAALEERVR